MAPDHDHPNFVITLVGKLGVPIVAATVVASLLGGSLEWSHGVLIGVGIACEGLHHWMMHHHRHRVQRRSMKGSSRD